MACSDGMYAVSSCKAHGLSVAGSCMRCPDVGPLRHGSIPRLLSYLCLVKVQGGMCHVNAAKLTTSAMQSPSCWRAFGAASIQALMSPHTRHALAQMLTLLLLVSWLDASIGSSKPVYQAVMQMIMSTGQVPGCRREQQLYVRSSIADATALLPAQMMWPEANAGCTPNQAI